MIITPAIRSNVTFDEAWVITRCSRSASGGDKDKHKKAAPLIANAYFDLPARTPTRPPKEVLALTMDHLVHNEVLMSLYSCQGLSNTEGLKSIFNPLHAPCFLKEMAGRGQTQTPTLILLIVRGVDGFCVDVEILQALVTKACKAVNVRFYITFYLDNVRGRFSPTWSLSDMVNLPPETPAHTYILRRWLTLSAVRFKYDRRTYCRQQTRGRNCFGNVPAIALSRNFSPLKLQQPQRRRGDSVYRHWGMIGSAEVEPPLSLPRQRKGVSDLAYADLDEHDEESQEYGLDEIDELDTLIEEDEVDVDDADDVDDLGSKTTSHKPHNPETTEPSTTRVSPITALQSGAAAATGFTAAEPSTTANKSTRKRKSEAAKSAELAAESDDDTSVDKPPRKRKTQAQLGQVMLPENSVPLEEQTDELIISIIKGNHSRYKRHQLAPKFFSVKGMLYQAGWHVLRILGEDGTPLVQEEEIVGMVDKKQFNYERIIDPSHQVFYNAKGEVRKRRLTNIEQSRQRSTRGKFGPQGNALSAMGNANLLDYSLKETKTLPGDLLTRKHHVTSEQKRKADLAAAVSEKMRDAEERRRFETKESDRLKIENVRLKKQLQDAKSLMGKKKVHLAK